MFFKLCSLAPRICISERLPFINFKGVSWNDKELKGGELNDVQLKIQSCFYKNILLYFDTANRILVKNIIRRMQYNVIDYLRPNTRLAQIKRMR